MLDSAVDQAVEPIKLDFSPDDLALDPHLDIARTQCRRGQAHERPILQARAVIAPGVVCPRSPLGSAQSAGEA